MSEELTFPTWKDVGVPPALVSKINYLSKEPVLDVLLLDKVFHIQRKLSCNYRCGQCQYSHRPNRFYDDYPHCARCKSKAITCSVSYKPLTKNKIYENGNGPIVNRTNDIILNMYNNFCHFFVEDSFDSTDIFTLKWTASDFFTVKFLGGDVVFDEDLSLALAKASLLCPFLWDSCFDWHNKVKLDKNRAGHISPLLHDWIN